MSAEPELPLTWESPEDAEIRRRAAMLLWDLGGDMEKFHRARRSQRLGQAWFNALPDDIAVRLAGTDIDPFHDDARLPAALDFVEGQNAGT